MRRLHLLSYQHSGPKLAVFWQTAEVGILVEVCLTVWCVTYIKKLELRVFCVQLGLYQQCVLQTGLFAE